MFEILDTMETFVEFVIKSSIMAFDLNYNFVLNAFNLFVFLIYYITERLEYIESFLIKFTELLFSLFNLIPRLCVLIYDYFNKPEEIEIIEPFDIDDASDVKVVNNLEHCLYSFLTLFLAILIIFMSCYFKHKIYLLQSRNKVLERNQIIYMCCICRYEHSNVVLLPCKHLCVCLRCFYMLKKNDNQTVSIGNEANSNCCPMCRTKIEDSIRIYA